MASGSWSAGASPFRAVAGGVTVAVRLTPKARREGIEGVTRTAAGAALKVSVAAAPEDGKANDALLRLLADEWNLPRARLSLKRGASSRQKVVMVEGDGLLPRLSAGRRRNG